MEAIESVRSRRSIRSFKPDPVPRDVLEELLETCRWAPSSRNTQPWELFILGGKVLEEIKDRLAEKVKTKAEYNPDIPLPDLPEAYQKRALEARDSIGAQQFPPGTDNLKAKRAEFWVRGGRFHDAPNAIILCVEKALCPKAIFDAGIMAQTIATAAPAYGLGTCLMALPIYWPDIFRELIDIPESKLIALGIAVGYPDPDAAINNYPRHRVSLEAFTHWHGI